MKLLITGACGQVGRELVLRVQKESIYCASYSRDQLDITQLEATMSAISAQNYNMVINAAAYTAVDKAEEDGEAAYRVNRDGVKNLALACREQNIPLLHISTDFVFDGEKHLPYSEDDATHPINIYGKSKLAGEQCIQEIWDKHIILRTSWVYSQHRNNFVKTMLRLMQERDTVRVVGDQWGCPTSACSIARTLVDIAKYIMESNNPPWGLYHFSDAGKTNWYEFAKEIQLQTNEFKELNVSIEAITSEDWVCAAKRPRNSLLSSEKLTKTFAITPDHWQTQLKPVIQSLATNIDTSRL